MKNYTVEFNALRLTVFGDFEPVFIADFSTSEGLGAAIGFGCERINAVSTRELQYISTMLGFTVIGYVDAHGYEKNHIPNGLMQQISGYSLLMGPGILCGWQDNDYAPLETWQVEELTRFLTCSTHAPAGKTQSVLAAFKVAGQAEYEEGMQYFYEGQMGDAHAMYEKAAEMGYADGLNAAAIDYLWGEGVEKDVPRGLQMMQQAAAEGSAKANRNFGLYYLSGDFDLPEDPVKAKQYLQEGAELGDSAAMAWLAYILRNEAYGFKNVAKAAYWVQRALKQDESVGWMVLGMLILDDEYYAYQPGYVRYCFERHAEMENITLQDVIEVTGNQEEAEKILNAKPVEPDYPIVPQWVRDEDFPDPEEEFYRVLEMLKSEDKAQESMDLLLEVADSGHTQACSFAFMHLMDVGQGDSFQIDEEGEIVSFPADEVQSLEYMNVAARCGDRVCMRLRPFMGAELCYAQKYLQHYIDLTGDWTMEKYVLPNLAQVLDGNENIPWLFPEEFEAAEAAVKHLYQEEMSIEERIDALENADAPECEQEIHTLLEFYDWIRRIQG